MKSSDLRLTADARFSRHLTGTFNFVTREVPWYKRLVDFILG